MKEDVKRKIIKLNKNASTFLDYEMNLCMLNLLKGTAQLWLANVRVFLQ